MTGNIATAVVTTTPVAMLFVADQRLFYSMGLLVGTTCVVVITSTLLGCWRRERRLENLKTRAKRRGPVRDNHRRGNDCY